jgi:hypothetical protein
VGRPDFKSGKGCRTVLGGFDSRSLPPTACCPQSEATFGVAQNCLDPYNDTYRARTDGSDDSG